MTSAEPAVIAVVRDLFFVARIRETARLTRVLLVFARTLDELTARLSEPTRFVLLDLTGGFDHEAMLAAIASAGAPPVLGFTTHALAKQTQPLHARCTRVVTKETLTQELPALLRDGVAA
jgi:hypothetical protein